MENKSKDKLRQCNVTKQLCSVVKCFIFAACIGGFSYHLIQFILHFYKYPTVLGLEIKEPDHFIEPAITVCNLNPVKRSRFCHKYPEKCEHLRNMKSFCNLRSHYCHNANMSNFKIVTEPWIDFNEDDDNRKILDELIDTNVRSFIWPDHYSNFKENYIGPFFLNSALTCYVLHSRAFNDMRPIHAQFSKHLRKSRMSQSTLVSKSWININESETYDYSAMPGALLAIHSPFEVVDPNFEGILLKPGKNYKIHVRLEENHLLPHPYQTDCRDYDRLWKMNNGTGPRSKQVCINNCWAVYDRACYNCSKQLMKSRLTETCKAIVQAYCDIKLEGDKLKICLSLCKVECTQRKYIYRVQEEFREKHLRNLHERRLTHLEVVIDEPQVLVHVHKPQYLAIELFSYIGGFSGCWLGISIWSSSFSILRFTKRFLSKPNKEEELMNNRMISPEIHSYFGVNLDTP